jgi:TonB family protein
MFIVFTLLLVSCQRTEQPKGQKIVGIDSSYHPAYAPIPIEKHQPVWPEIMRRADIPGDVELSLLVDESGKVVDVKVVKSLHPIVDSPSVQAAWKWKFEPGRIPDAQGNFRESKFWVPLSFNWSLH